ncbi:MAG: DUF2953 domain-containing protein [Lawsonibacter sp.]|jgi:hypothetical protein
MMWAVLAAILAALFLLGGLRVGLRGEYTPETAGAWLRIGPAELRVFPRPAEKKTDRPKKVRRDGPAGEKQPRPPFLSRRGLLELGRRLFPLLLEAAGQFRRKLQIDELRLRLVAGAPDPADAALRYGQANALLGGIWQPVTRAFHVKDGRARVEVDFDRTEPALYGRVSLSLTVGQLAVLGLGFGLRALGVLMAVRREEKQRTGQRQSAAVGSGAAE